MTSKLSQGNQNKQSICKPDAADAHHAQITAVEQLAALESAIACLRPWTRFDEITQKLTMYRDCIAQEQMLQDETMEIGRPSGAAQKQAIHNDRVPSVAQDGAAFKDERFELRTWTERA